MKIDEIFAKSDTFSAQVKINIPGNGSDRKFTPTVKFRYITQEQVDALLAGEDVEIDGETIGAGDDAGLLEKVLVGWSGWKVGGEEIQYDAENHAMALNHIPIRTPMVAAFFERLRGGELGARGKRKNS